MLETVMNVCARRAGVITVLLILFHAPCALAQEAPEYGPAKGTLVIVGGGNLEGTGIIEKFIELAGGRDKQFVIVPDGRWQQERRRHAEGVRRG